MDNGYKFNGIEEGSDFELNYQEAFYRYMDVQTGRFIQIDPVTTHNESPYVMMGNNPIVNIDWLGNYFKFASDNESRLFQRMRDANNTRLDNYKAIRSDLQKQDPNSEDVKTQMTVVESLIKFAENLNNQWDEMDRSDIEFNVSSDHTISDGGQTTYNSEKNRIDIKLNEFNERTLGHEIRHGYSYLNGESVGTCSGADPLYNSMVEVAGYNVGFFIGPFKDDDIKVVNGFYSLEKLKQGVLSSEKYRRALAGKDKQLTLNSPAAELIGFSQDGTVLTYVRENSGNANLTVRDVFTALNKKASDQGLPAPFIFGDALKNRQNK